MDESQAYDCLLASLMKEVEARGGVFSLNEGLKERISHMARWLVADKGKCGMLLCGGCGNGKTTFVKAFRTLLNFLQVRDTYNNCTYGMRFMTAKEIASLYRTNFKAWHDLATCTMLAIDDMGCEPTEVMDFGNVSNPLVDLLTIRYEEQYFTIISTNLRAADIRAKYGDRIADRMNEMLDRIYFDNSTYRTDQFRA